MPCSSKSIPGKTFIGGIEKGFDFLGYRFTPRSLTVARMTIENFLERALRLYEQEPAEREGSPALESYVTLLAALDRGGVVEFRCNGC